jgi:hypothetical protein
MEKWNTTLRLKTKQEEMQSPTHSDTKRNIPGGLSVPLIFCIALIPLTNEINGAKCGQQYMEMRRKISHLLYGRLETLL